MVGDMAAEREDDDYRLPDFPSTPSDWELVDKHLRPAIERMSPEIAGRRRTSLPLMVDPWDLLQGTTYKEDAGRRREKYFLADGVLADNFPKFTALGGRHTPEGTWKPRGLGYGITDGSGGRFRGMKRTYDYHYNDKNGLITRRLIHFRDSSWIMNVYYLIDQNGWMQSTVASLCHVLEARSKSRHKYDPSRDAPRFINHKPAGEIWSPLRYYLPHTTNVPHRRNAPTRPAPLNTQERPETERPNTPRNSPPLDPQRLRDIIAEVEKLIFTDGPEPTSAGLPETTTEHHRDPGDGGGPPPTTTSIVPSAEESVQPKKRKKTSSDVWNHFSKIFAHGPDGEVLALAACNRCFMILTASSKNGTSSLRRHMDSCPCSVQPVDAVENYAEGGTNALSS